MADTGTSVSQILSGASSVFGSMSELQNSNAQAASLSQQAEETRFQADIERVNAKGMSNDLRQQLNDTLANNSAALSTMGIDAGSGSALIIQQQEMSKANRAVRGVQLDASIREASLKRRAANLQEASGFVRRQGKRQAKLSLVNTWFKFVSMGG